MILQSLANSGCSGNNNETNVHSFLQESKSTELEAAVNVVWVQPKKYTKYVDTMVPYPCQMVIMKGYNMQFVNIEKNRSQKT